MRVWEQPREPQLVCLTNWVDKQRIHVDIPCHNNAFFTEKIVLFSLKSQNEHPSQTSNCCWLATTVLCALRLYLTRSISVEPPSLWWLKHSPSTSKTVNSQTIHSTLLGEHSRKLINGLKRSQLWSAVHLVSDAKRIGRKSDAVHVIISWFIILYVHKAHTVLHVLRHYIFCYALFTLYLYK